MTRESRRWALFPLLVVVAFLVLVGLNLSGSSISLLSPTHQGLVAGQPRAIRSDEWQLQTPLAISSTKQGFPTDAWIGISSVDQAAASHAGPTHDWSEVLKPADWGYLLFGPGLGLAVSWWAPYALSLLGCFALLGLLTRRPLLSAGLAAAATFTPYAGWWSSPAPGLFIGLASATAACTIAAWRAPRRRVALLWAVVGALFAAAFAVALYPPWQISIGWIVAMLCIGHAIDHRVSWRRFVWPLAVQLGIAVLVLAAWYVGHRDAIRAQADTLYPGHRIAGSGDGSLGMLLDAPLNFWLTHGPGATLSGVVGRPAGNLSEAASSWLPLPLLGLILCGAVVLAVSDRRRGDVRGPATGTDPDRETLAEAERAPRPTWTLILTSLATGLLLLWSLAPLPSFVGRATQLYRVETARLPLALGFAAILLVAAAASRSAERVLLWRWPFLLLSVLATAALTLWAAHQLPWRVSTVPAVGIILSGAVVAAAFALVLVPRLQVVGLVVLTVYALVSWAGINPLQHGIGPVQSDPLAQRLEALTKKHPGNPRVEVFARQGQSLAVVAKVRAAGLQSLTGTTDYPDASLMRALAPTRETQWNNYAQYVWHDVPATTTPSISPIHGTLMQLNVPVCDPVILARAKPGWVVADHRLSASCIAPAGRVEDAGSRLWIYRLVQGS